MKDTSKAGISEKISFGFGAVAYCTEMMFVMSYITLFCTDVLAIDIALIGFVMSAVRILDAVTDIAITNLADRTNTKWGKYRVWVLFGIPLAIMMFLLFSSPGFLQTERLKTIWVIVCYILLVPIIETSLNCPYNALIMTMSKHSSDQFDFTMSRALGEAVAQLFVSAVAMPVLMLTGSYRNASSWRLAAGLFSVVIMISALICFFGTKERVKVTNLNSEGDQLSMKEKFSAVAKNGAFWKVIILNVLNTAQYYIQTSLFSYYCINSLGHTEWVSPLLSIGTALQVAVTIALIIWGKKFEKRTLLIIGGGCIMAACALLFICHSFPVAVLYELLVGTGSGTFTSIVFALIPDVAEYVQWKSGKAIPGMVSAFVTFAIKLGASISTLLVTQLIVFIQYDATLEVQSELTLSRLRTFMPLSILIILVVAMIIVLSLTELTNKKMNQYRSQVD